MTIGADLQQRMEERNEEIYDLKVRGGLSYRALGQRFGLSHERIRQIVTRQRLKKVEGWDKNKLTPDEVS